MRQNNNQRAFWKNLFILQLPRAHLLAAGAVVAGVILLFTLLPSEEVEAKRRTHAIVLPIPVSVDENRTANPEQFKTPDQQGNAIVAATSTPNEGIAPAAPTTNWQETAVKHGDNLTTVFRRLGLDDADVYAVANASREAKYLRRLKPGETFAVTRDKAGHLAEVKYSRSSLEHYLYSRRDNTFNGEQILFQPETIPAFVSGTINSSLFLDAASAGLGEAKIMELANIFGWDIDFALDIRRGDTFQILFEEKYLEGEKIGDGDILAAAFSNQGKTLNAVRFIEPDGRTAYYTPEGKPMRKAFLRAPLDFTRISSNFNLRRKHPIHKKIRAHRGVDYAAPRGTPVYAAGSGKVTASGYSRANGNYVFVQHGQKFITKYLHLDKRRVRKGQIVKQKQTIGTVGATGYATGPHLHYEFLVNGVHRNPRTVKLPEASAIANSQRAEFFAQTGPLLSKLKQFGTTQLALNTASE